MSEIRTTKDGEEINLKDMTDEHIINCIKIIKRDGLIVKECYCGGYDGVDGDVEIYRDEIGERERQDSNRHDADKSMIIPFIGLCGAPGEKEISLANKEYNEYQMNKLCYIGTDCYIAFNEMEDDILNNIGTTLEGESERQDDFSLWKLLEATRKEIETMITTSPKGSRIKYFLPNGSHKRGVTLQHHQDKKITIKIRDSKAIYQINDENEGNDRDG